MLRNPSSSRVLALGLVASTGLLLAACGSDGSDGTPSSSTSRQTTIATTTTTTTKATTTTSAAATSTSTPSSAQPETAVWPFASSSTRFSDPVAAARSFAVDYLGFVDPVVGAFQQGDSRSGEVPVQPEAKGPTTTVFVRMLGPDDSWWVLGSATASLHLTSPAALASIASPVALSGRSTAFEATINIEVRQDGSTDPLAEAVAMGGSNGEMGPFSTSVPFDAPSASAGAILLKTLSAKDGSVWEASVVRVAFAP